MKIGQRTHFGNAGARRSRFGPDAGGDDNDPEFAEPGTDADAYADTVGPDTARAARAAAKTHRYPRSKFAGGATGEVLAGAFGPDAA